MDWVTGILTLASMQLIIMRRWEGWLVGLINQVFWVLLIWDKALWGLIPLTAFLTVQYAIALVLWRRM